HLLSLATPGAGSRVCFGSSPTAWPRGTRPTRARWGWSTPGVACAPCVRAPRSGLLDPAPLPNLAGYAYSTTTVTQAVDQLRREFEERSAGFDLLPVPSMPALAPAGAEPLVPGGPNAGLALVQAPDTVGPPMGPPHFVLVDDYDLLPAASGSPLLPLLDLLGLGRELGFHLV